MSGRQTWKALIIIVVSYAAVHLLVYFLGDALRGAINELLGVLVYAIAVICAISLVMFTYVDNTAKDLTDLRNDVNREKYKAVQRRLSLLKHEIIANAAVVIAFFAIEYVIKSFVNHILIGAIFENVWLIETIGVALRFSCFSIVLFAASSQILGFLIAVEFREQIANNRK